MGTLRKLGLCGSESGKHKFSYPENLDVMIQQQTAVKMSKRFLHRITCGIFDAIGSIQLHFKDGAETEQFGQDTKG